MKDNGIEYVTNNLFKKVREKLIEKFNKFYAITKNKTLIEIIEYCYNSKKLSESIDEKNNFNNGIKLIKEFNKKENLVNIRNKKYKIYN